MSDNTAKRDINHKRHTARYRARRRAADILYEAENRDVDPVAIVEDRVALAREDRHAVAPIADYTKVIVQGVAEELDAIDDTISRYLSQNWELHRIPAVDRAILRLSVWELLFNPDVPTATAVVEGVELASQYSHDQAAPYIHAVLDDVAQSRSELSPMNNGGDEEESDAAESEDSQEDSADSTHTEAPGESEDKGESAPAAEAEADAEEENS
ncbi:transcription antitermination factor NusB [Corynebacterium accolens]|uniref:Transcription antitermination protein NusB n=1 Tax=Corynebacterium segmentosum TaxID=43990 RepID=A0ABY6TFA0_9CORY|nr:MULTISPECIES: transcription antitermination factor NusB [Corynebacterium]MDK4266933.1 transcription antitermination factor NusB [Corynebacterium accolens]MDK4274749.1 transcription antitermination factor NusB [Corynebacterium accolens]MDK4279702.1 transcription antitermination factor NusB [Corynebacterium accolens]MDK4308335.1 transcription antitermination factor NusB [Corynebacterium accolens]MDK4330520.1 transcription antitermination factor NusB [Corynebacterium accolens]